jgi:hypothetical protein
MDEPLPGHDHFCTKPRMVGNWCLSCFGLINIREDERLQTIDQIRLLPADATRDEIIDAIEPVGGDLRRRPIARFAFLADEDMSEDFKVWLREQLEV